MLQKYFSSNFGFVQKKKGHRADGRILFSDFMLFSKKKRVIRLTSASFLLTSSSEISASLEIGLLGLYMALLKTVGPRTLRLLYTVQHRNTVGWRVGLGD